MGYRTVTVDVDVDVDIQDFSDSELVEELELRGYSVSEKKKNSSWDKPSYDEEELDDVLWALRQSYIIEGGDKFRKSFENILAEYGYYV